MPDRAPSSADTAPRVVQRLAPDREPVDAEALVSQLTAAPALEPFADEAVACCAALSRTLSGLPRTRSHPELGALAHWLRPVSVLALRHQFARLSSAGSPRAPRGLAFHVAPANLDTVGGYSLALSFLVGNRNVVRVSPRAGEQTELLCRALDGVLADERFASLRAGTALVRYGHEAEANQTFSRACDVRIAWGEDETVASLRRVPLAPAAKELTFPDRFSFALASAEAYLEADDGERDLLADQLALDAYPFHQRPCSSPRLLVWLGWSDHAGAAGEDLFPRLADAIADRGYELNVRRLADLAEFDRSHPAAGPFFEAVVPELAELGTFVSSEDHTVTAFGLQAGERSALAAAGVDHVVPWGQALTLGRHWDGLDLLAELTRAVPIRAAA